MKRTRDDSWMDQMEARARAHRVQGDENMKQEKWDEALAALRAAVAQDPLSLQLRCKIRYRIFLRFCRKFHRFWPTCKG